MFGPEGLQGINAIQRIEGEVTDNIINASDRRRVLRDNVEDMLVSHGITTGLDTPMQTAWKKIKTTVKEKFTQIVSKIQRRKALKSAKDNEEIETEETGLEGSSNAEEIATSQIGEKHRNREIAERVEASDEVKKAISEDIPRQYKESQKIRENSGELEETINHEDFSESSGEVNR